MNLKTPWPRADQRSEQRVRFLVGRFSFNSSILVLFLAFGPLAGCGGKAKVGPAPEGTAHPLSVFENRVLEAPHDLEARLDLVRAYLDADSARSALEQAQAAVDLDSTSKTAMAWLAVAQLRTGEQETALVSLYRVLTSPDVSAELVTTIGREIGHPYQLKRITDGPGNDAFPFLGPKGKKLAFQSDRDGNWDIYLLDLQTTAETRLTDHPARDESPAFSPDGNLIAFTSTRNDSSGRSQENLRRDIFLLQLGDRRIRDLVVHPADDWFPRFGPKGQLVYFVSERDDPRPIPPSEKRGEIYRIRLSDRSITRMTENTYDDTSPWPTADGKWLFVVNNSTGHFAVAAVRLDSQTPFQTIVEPKSLGVEDVGSPSVSADGRRLVLVGSRGKNYDLYFFDRTTGFAQQLTRHPAVDHSPVINEKGDKIYFHSNRSGRFQLYVLDLKKPASAPELAEALHDELNRRSQGSFE